MLETPDNRGAGGRAPRVRTPSIVARVASPILQALRGSTARIAPSPTNKSNHAGAAAQRASPSPAQNNQASQGREQEKRVVQSGFSFPALAGATESPPSNTFVRPASGTHATPQESQELVVAAAHPEGTDDHVDAGTAAQSLATKSQNATLQAGKALISPCTAARETNTALSEWSPAKMASLHFFLSGGTYGGSDAPAAAPLPTTQAALVPPVIAQKGVYFDLHSLLKAGPGGNVRKGNGTLGSATTAHLPSARMDVAAPSMRYNPYNRPNLPRPPRQGSSALASQAPPGTVPSSRAPTEAGRQQPQTSLMPSVAVAAAQVSSANPRLASLTSAAAPRPPHALRLAPGQMALPSGRSGTPLPKVGPLVLKAQQPAHSPANGRALAGAVGGAKRQRDSPAASPLIASGIRNLTEFKKRRQAHLGEERALLTGPIVRTPRARANADNDQTPVAVSSGGSEMAAATPTPTAGGGAVETLQTETARKMIGFLNSCERTSDAIATTSNNLGGVTGSQPDARAVPLMGSPLPGPLMPPLGRLDENHYGGTPTPSVMTGAVGFAYGATPSPLGNPCNANQTPGPRMVLEFDTPSACPASESSRRLDDISEGLASPADIGTRTIPLSPIPVPQVETTGVRDTSYRPSVVSGPAVALPAEADLSGTTKDVWGRTDVAVPTSLINAAGDESGSGAGVNNNVPKFSFRQPQEPLDDELRRIKAVCDAHMAMSVSGDSSDIFTFGPATVGVYAQAPVGKAGASHTSWGSAADEVAKAAEVPLPDDDEDDVGVGASTPAATMSAPMSSGQPQVKSTSAGITKRVAFVDQPDATTAPNQKGVDEQAKGPETVRMATPLATPGGFFYSSHAGSTPFRPSFADEAPACTVAGEKASASGDKDVSDAPRQSAFSFGTSSSAPAAGLGDIAKPISTQTHGRGIDSSMVTGQALLKNPCPEVANLPVAVPLDKAETSQAPADIKKVVPPSDLGQPGPAPDSGSLQPASSPALGQLGIGTAAAPVLGFTFGAPGASVAATGPAVFSSASVGTAIATSASFSGATSNTFLTSSRPSFASEPALTSSAAPVPSVGVATMNAPPSAVAVGFNFNAPGSSSAASSSATTQAPSTVTAPSITFGVSQPVASSSTPSFGSPMPVANPVSASTFGTAQTLAGSVGFGLGGPGPASSAAMNFTFGGSLNSSSNAGSSAPTQSNTGFDIHQGPSSLALPFTFGAAASAPTFAVATALAVPSSAPSSQPAVAGGTSPFGAGTTVNPFGAAAPSFGASASQPVFGALPPISSGTTAFGAAVVPMPAAQPANAAPAFGNSTAPTTTQPGFGGFGSSNDGTSSSGLFNFGAGAAPPFAPPQPASSPVFGHASQPLGMQTQTAQVPAAGVGSFGVPNFGAPASFGASGSETGAGFSLGVGDPKEGRKKYKARRHGH